MGQDSLQARIRYSQYVQGTWCVPQSRMLCIGYDRDDGYIIISPVWYRPYERLTFIGLRLVWDWQLGRDLLHLTTVTASDENSAQPDICQTWVDIEYAGGERILYEHSPQMNEYRLQVRYDVIGAIVQPSRLSLLAEGGTTSTGESTTEAPSATTHAESPLTSAHRHRSIFYVLESLLPLFTTGGISSSTKSSDQTCRRLCSFKIRHLSDVAYNPPVWYLVQKSVPVLGFDGHSPAIAALNSVALQSSVPFPENPLSSWTSLIMPSQATIYET
ncbi:uncharacterized protein ARMOST_20446 [Armillaria ostoyae]|uniref:Uncharacterized protein n=1 Tax=Armillaria ostoyae TaxID=47428 RepID=A0A284S7E7_ARMOS|nr:uncharacterized protein ARMOST_20446 [Armillaria ostoyae]